MERKVTGNSVVLGSNCNSLQELDFLGSSDGKQSACNAGGLGLIPWSGRFPGEGIGYPLQCSWASLVAQMVKNPPTCRIPGLERCPRGGHDNPLPYPCLENPHGQRSLVDYSPWSHRVRHNWETKHTAQYISYQVTFNTIKKQQHAHKENKDRHHRASPKVFTCL